MKKIDSMINCCLGNVLEWYDFGLFAIFSPLFSRLFFPATDSRTAMIEIIAIFAIGFICRPIGALLFGYLGDHYGRAFTLRLSVLTISLPTLFIGMLPTYEAAGIIAPLLLMLIRMMQGISIGGEYGGNLIYLTESASARFRATTAALASMGANFGVMLASLTGLLLTSLYTQHFLDSIGWRIPYLVSGIVCLLLYTYRLKMAETAIFTHLQEAHLVTPNPIKTIFTMHLPHTLRILGLVCMGSTFYFFCFVFLPIFLAQRQLLDVKQISILMSFLMLLMIMLVPLAGLLCDVIGRRNMLLFNALLVVLIVVPGFYLLHFNHVALTLLVLIVFTIASTLEQGTTPAALVEHFPAATRYTGLSLGYNLGNGLLGGTIPMIATWLASESFMGKIAPAIYVAVWASVTYLVVYFFIPSSNKIIDLND